MSSVSSVRVTDLPRLPPPREVPPRDAGAQQRTAPPASDAAGRETPRPAPANDPEALRNRAIARATKPDPEGRPAQEQAGRQAIEAAGRYANHGRPAGAPPAPRLRIDA